MLKICVTGATGFVGKNLIKRLSQREDIEVIALSRRLSLDMDGAKKGNVTWRRCDGFSLIDAENGTEGADILIYLIHSMLPSTNLSQGSFSDFDLYLADNFARAARKNGLKRIIYLGGLIPETPNLSEHLRSRLEVENALRQYENKFTSLRAGLIVGKDGSSFRILERLVRRLPILICPSWTLSRTQPIDLQDVLASLEYTIDHYENLEQSYDIGGPDVLTYKDMLLKTAELLNRKRLTVNLPFFTPSLSKLWVSRVVSTTSNLVYPLVESLKHEMVVDPQKQLKIPGHTYTPFMDSLKNGLDRDYGGWVRDIIDYNAKISFSWLKIATSIQRVSLTKEIDAHVAAKQYFSWLPMFLLPLVRVVVEKGEVSFYIFSRRVGVQLLHLKKSEDRSDIYRSVYYVTGGLLAHRKTLNGRLEFRYVGASQCLLMALLNYRPALPWFVYKFTQAIVHLYVMRSFGRHIRRS